MPSKPSRIRVEAQPNARQNAIVGYQDGVLKLRVAAPPVGGKANEALLRFLAELLGTPKSDLSVEKGLISRHKTVAVRGLTQEEVDRRLARRAALGLHQDDQANHRAQ